MALLGQYNGETNKQIRLSLIQFYLKSYFYTNI